MKVHGIWNYHVRIGPRIIKAWIRKPNSIISLLRIYQKRQTCFGKIVLGIDNR
jgi:hypothetical protein